MELPGQKKKIAEYNLKPESRQKRICNIPPDKRKSWLPGQSGNPNGRPLKDRCIPDTIRLIGNQLVPESVKKELNNKFPDENFDNMTYLQAMVFIQFRKTLDGDDASREFLVNRTEGLLTQSMKIESNNRTTLNDQAKADLAKQLMEKSAIP
jgi:hypothetical protein